ncbi:MAG TPA: polymer-forming cytoskeletal protein [Candidatus Saccharimonadales bacterium]
MKPLNKKGSKTMRTWKAAVLALAILLVPLIAGVGIVQATSFKHGDEVKIGNNEKIDHSLFVVGGDITIEATVDGDVFCAGRTVTITGKVNGDVLCAAQTIRLSGDVEGNVRVAGMDVVLNGRVAKSASIAAQSFSVDSKAVVGRDLSAAAATVTMNGSVRRDITITSDEAQVNGKVGRDVSALVDSLSLGSSANITGDVYHHSYKDLRRADGAKVSGEISRHTPPETEAQQVNAGTMLMDAFMGFLMVLLVGIIIALAAPRMLRGLVATAEAKPGMVALTGAVSLATIPIVMILSFLTIVGILFGGILLVASILLLMVSTPLAGYFGASLLLRNKSNIHPVLTMTLGVAILSVLYMIPFVNFFAIVATAVFGVGMVVYSAVRYNFGEKRSKAKLVKSV